MAIIEVKMPQMGESITEGTITKWYKKIGDKINKDETLLEISTDKVDSEIPSPAAGILAEIIVQEQTTVPVHTVIAKINSESSVVIEKTATVTTPQVEIKQTTSQPEIKINQTKTEKINSDKFFSPLVINIARDEGISLSELETIVGTGGGGRVSKNDVLNYSNEKKKSKSSSAISGNNEVVKMDNMRKLIAEHMVRSVHTSAHVGSVTEADVTSMVEYREKNKSNFEKQNGFKLTLTPFFLEVVAKSLKDFPYLNSSIEGDNIILHNDVNIGVAVALESGLIVPVIKNADKKSLSELAKTGNDLATRARSKKLLPDEVQQGTFTVTNPGIFGNLYGFPIINQPQVAILGIGAVKKRAVIINDEIKIRSMVYISMSYDHRIIDGALGGQFLQRVVEYLENFNSSRNI
ncbi:MAG: dihydrolipoamide acetyltransferase family protein [Bacteroidetes bacterium]|nr:dihydrolipoamide acetyltransferase family protein [Bacteroidota bacterium]